EVPLMTLIPIVIIGWTITFYIYKRRIYKFKALTKDYFFNSLKNQTYQVSLMLSIGALIYSLNQTNFAENVVGGLNFLENYISWLNPLYLLPFIVIILSFLSLRPTQVIVLNGSIFNNLGLPYSTKIIVLTNTSGNVISILISPVIMPLIVLSASNGLSLFTNGFKFNWKYSLVFYAVTQLYIQLMFLF